MNRQEEILVCDQCKKEVSDQGKQWFCGHPFSKWIHLQVRGGSTALHELQRKKSFDFCSKACLLRFLKEDEGLH